MMLFFIIVYFNSQPVKLDVFVRKTVGLHGLNHLFVTPRNQKKKKKIQQTDLNFVKNNVKDHMENKEK